MSLQEGLGLQNQTACILTLCPSSGTLSILLGSLFYKLEINIMFVSYVV